MADITLTKRQARQFLLYYHGLNHNDSFSGKEGILAYIQRVGCIQFDPLNVVGMNPELVLQSRVQDYDSRMLWELLYEDRKLIDYWDKCMSIFPIQDWPYFAKCRSKHQAWCDANAAATTRIRSEIEQRGPLCSGDLDDNEKVDWAWGPTRLSRAALEGMYHAGHLVISNKVKTRKYYDLANRLIPQDIYTLPDTLQSDEQYNAWYVLRRIGSVGLLWNRPSDAWLGIIGMKTAERKQAFASLMKNRSIIEVAVEGLAEPLYIRSTDLELLKQSLSLETPENKASFLAPLDNLMWDRNLIHALFDFEYRWEVYKPAAERKYGYYVLPVVYGDRIVARFDPVKHRKGMPLTIANWWWEDSVTTDPTMRESILSGLERFAAYLGTYYDRKDFIY